MEAFIKFVGGAFVAAALILGGQFFNQPVVDVPTPPLGSVTGPDVPYFTRFFDNVNVGGYDLATSSQGTVTYTALNIVRSHIIEHVAAGATTATLPTNAALSAAGFLPNIGDSQVVYFHASTTAITLAGNTGVTLHSASSTLKVAAGSIGRLECTRLSAVENRAIWCLLIAD